MHRYINRFSKERNYDEEITQIIAKSAYKFCSDNILTLDDDLQLWAMRINHNSSNPYVFISAGVHGDEPAGVKAALKFIEELDQYPDFNFIILPCVNPVGYERNIREGSDFQDINREFYDKTDSPENKAILEYLSKGPYNYLFSMDLHETRASDKPINEYPPNQRKPDGFHMWEICKNKDKRIGKKIIEAVSKVTDVCKWSRVWGDTNSSGVIYYPEGAMGEQYGEANVFERYMHDNYTQHSFTTETFSGAYGGNGENLEERIQTHLTVLRTALQEIR